MPLSMIIVGQHQQNYDDDVVVCSQDHLRRALSEYVTWFSETEPDVVNEIIHAAEGMSLEPEIMIQEKFVEVRITVFTKWGGLYRITYKILRNPPHVIFETGRRNLVKYNCGMLY